MTSTADDALVIPGSLNGLLLGTAVAASVGLLWLGSQSTSAWSIALCVLAFSFTANTLFSLLHEAVHGVFHPHRGLNEWGGRIAALFFPTSLAIQRAYHLTHHRNNRSPAERFDYLQPGDIVWLKRAQWYSILTGFYWVVALAGLALYVVIPPTFHDRFLTRARSQAARQTSFSEYHSALRAVNPYVARAEILAAFAFHAMLIGVWGVDVGMWLLCYGAFAVQWSGLQYADHAFSPLERRTGAWDLRVNPVSRLLFLNYHYHRAHHEHPAVPWVHLPRLVDSTAPQPRYWRIWLAMWRGPRPLPTIAREQ